MCWRKASIAAMAVMLTAASASALGGTGDSARAREPNPDALTADGASLLAWAVERQDVESVRQLLSRGAHVNGTSSVAPLMVACQYGDPAMLGMLLDAGADARTANGDDLSALALCAGSSPAATLARLIDGGAEVDRPDTQGQTALMRAAAAGRIENIKLLIARGANVNRATSKGFTPLFFALKSGVPAAPLAVVEAGGNVDYVAPDGTSVVQLAMYQHAYDFAARMIERGADLAAFDRTGNQLLHAAVLANQPALVAQLLAKGADANALQGPSKVEMRFEVNFKSAAYDVPAKPPLLLATEQGYASVMKLLVDAGADAKYRTNDGTNVVLAAAASGSLETLRFALQLAPNANVTTKDGQTPLHVLVGSGGNAETEAMMRLLASKGARPDARDRAGKTPADLLSDAPTQAREAFAAVFAAPAVAPNRVGQNRVEPTRLDKL